MIAFIGAALAALLLASPAQAQGFRPLPGPGINIATDGTISSVWPLKDVTASAYTVLATDNAFTLLLGAFTYTLPRAGSSAGQLPLNWGISVMNRSAGNATVQTTTSVFRGGGEATNLILSPGASAILQSDGTNWITFALNNHPMLTDAGTNRTIGNFEGELNATVNFTSSSPIAVALDATAFPGMCVNAIQGSTGQVTFAPSGSGGRHQADTFISTATQYAGMTWCVTSNTTGSNAQWTGFGRGAP